MLPTRITTLVPALFAVLLLTFASTAEAKRAPKAAKATQTSVKDGIKTSQWKANGTRFQHKTHGNSKIGWVRRATQKNGVTKISGKLWGNLIKGSESKGVEKVTVTAPTGETRTTTTTTAKNGTVRKTIDMPQQNMTRKITTWRSGSKTLQATRDYDRTSGKLISQSRSSVAAR